MKSEHKLIYRIAFFSILGGCCFLTWFVLFLSGTVKPFIYNFAVDSSDRLYIGVDKEIRVYDNGIQIYTIDAHSSKGYHFTINESENIFLATINEVYTMDLQGNIIDVQEDPVSHNYSRLQFKGRKLTSVNGDNYKLVGKIGWTRVVKNGVDTVYRISFLSFVSKILLYLSVLSLITLFAWCLWEKHMETRKGASA